MQNYNTLLVSFIIPCFNCEKTIARCLDSIFNQKIFNYEVIAINDGSTDKTATILDMYKKRHKSLIVVDKKNSGPSSSRNVGVRIAKGKYITFIDSDDYYIKCSLYEIFNILESSDIDAYRTLFFGEKSVEKIMAEDIYKGFFKTYIWLLFIKNEIAKKTFFNENIKMYEDYLYYIELFENIKFIKIINKKCYRHMYYFESLTRSKKEVDSKYNNVLRVAEIVEKRYHYNLQDFFLNRANQVYIDSNLDKKSFLLLKDENSNTFLKNTSYYKYKYLAIKSYCRTLIKTIVFYIYYGFVK